MTFAQFAACAARVEERENLQDQRAGVVATTIARVNGNKRAEPSTFFPHLKAKRKRKGGPEMTSEEQILYLSKFFPNGRPQ
jgi:hypothetical protein